MTSLKFIQQGFVQQLTHSQSADKFLRHLEPCGKLLPEQQVAIYQNNMRGALQSSLAQIYPVCLKILGGNYFKQLAAVYIKQYPSKHHDLNNYGEYFPSFMEFQGQQRSALSDFSYLGDLAKLEWFYQQVYYAAEAATFSFSAFSLLTELQQATCTFQLAPCLNFIHSDYPILSIWQLNQGDSTADQLLELNSENCCIFRKNNQIELLAIETNIFKLLTHISAGKALEELALLGYDNDLTELIKQQWISGFKVKHV